MEIKFLKSYKGKTVLITGNTGFKGSWLSLWLLNLGANVYGYSLEPPTKPSLYDQLNLKDNLNQEIGDIRNYEKLKNYIEKVKPDIIFHLAAQSLVRESYNIPLETYEVNVTGTIYLLEAIRQLNINTTVVCITSDKCYDNKEWIFGYRETDPMGGFDPYSASKGAAEIIINSYRKSFFNINDINDHGVRIASGRAGNVIGGGDWAKDRIVPDCIRYLQNQESIFVRNPYATRPWQHVIEPLAGYLLLAIKLDLANDRNTLEKLSSGFNFGPNVASCKNVRNLVEETIKHWPGKWHNEEHEAVHEATLLHLSIDKAQFHLNWTPIWNFEDTIKETILWYKTNHENPNILEKYSSDQIEKYCQKASKIKF